MEYIDGVQPAPAHRRARRADRRRRAAHRRERARRARRGAPRSASCTATSSPRTCCSPPTAASSSPTSAWRARSPRSPRRRPARCSARSPTSRPSSSSAASSDARTDVYACGDPALRDAHRAPAVHRRDADPGRVPARQQRRPGAVGAGRLAPHRDRRRSCGRSPRATPTTARSTPLPPSRCCAAPAPRSTTETLARHADVAPSIVLPAATDPAETDLDAEPTDRTTTPTRTPPTTSTPTRTRPTLLETGDARGSTVALPIGLGVSAAGARRAARPPAARSATAPRWIVLLAVLAALVGGGAWWYVQHGPGRVHDGPDDRRQDEAHATADPRATRGSAATPTSGLRRRRRRSARCSRPTPAQGEPHPQGRHRRVHVSKGPDYVAVPDGVVGEMQADAEAALVGRRAQGRPTPTRRTATRVDDRRGHQRDAARRHRPPSPAPRRSRGTVVTLIVSKGPAPVTITSVVGADRSTDATKQLDAGRPQAHADRGVQRHRRRGPDHRPEPRRRRRGPPRRHDQASTSPRARSCIAAARARTARTSRTAEAALEAAGFIVKVEAPAAASRRSTSSYVQKPGGGDGKTAPKGSTITLTVF